MARSIEDTPKKKRRGRPSTGGRREGVMVRLEPTQFEALDAWIKRTSPNMSRPGAIRRLVELGLNVKTQAMPASKPDRTLRAQELAWKTVEKLVDIPAAPPEERAQRQRRLTKRPEEFQEVRLDRPRANK
jgi:hypothetical protein